MQTDVRTLETVGESLASFADVFALVARTDHHIDDVACLTRGRTVENGFIAVEEPIALMRAKLHDGLLTMCETTGALAESTVVARKEAVAGHGLLDAEETFVGCSRMRLPIRACLHEEEIHYKARVQEQTQEGDSLTIHLQVEFQCVFEL